MLKEFPILEFDQTKHAVIEPSKIIKSENIAESAVICFFNDVLADLYNKGKLIKKRELRSEIGVHPVYEMDYNDKKVTVFHPGIGSPLAVGLLEEVIALGAKKFVACGGAGVLDREIGVGHILVPYAAVRDEGTSYHYALPSREIEIDQDAIEVITTVLERHKCKYMKVKTWTTDAIYRETLDKVNLRKAEGCSTVEMECSALAAVSKFRNVKFAQLLYAGDDVSCEEWDSRQWVTRTEIREQIFLLAVEASLEL